MVDIILTISDRDRRAIEAIARVQGGVTGHTAPATVNEMATALLQSHLILIRDCGGVLPGAGRPALPAARNPLAPAGDGAPAVIRGKHGVSLSRGSNGPR